MKSIVSNQTTGRFIFRSVGQGAFYTGTIGQLSNQNLSMVYDCGATFGKDPLNQEIGNFLYEIINRELSLLIISHFDEDHVNGLKKLLAGIDRIDTVVIPYVLPITRLYYYFKNVREDFNGENQIDYIEFLEDPISYLFKYVEIKNLILLDNSEQEGTPFFSEDDDGPQGEGGEALPLNDSLFKRRPQFKPRDDFEEEVYNAEELLKQQVSNLGTQIIFESYATAIQSAYWRFDFFNYDKNAQWKNEFQKKMKSNSIYCSNSKEL